MEAMITAPLIINLMLILVAALVMGNVFSRFGQPFLLGQLLAGLLLGPAFLGLIGPSDGIELLADLGIFFVMFHSGMETDPKLLLAKLKHSLIVAAGGFVLPFALGYLTTRFFGGTVFQALFVGMGISISAIAVQVVILHDMKINRTSLGHVIIGAAIADDILALVTLSVLINVAESGSAQPGEIAFILLKVGAFFGAAILLGHYVVPRFTRRFHEREGRAFTFAITVALVLAFLAELAGLHLIIGAFLAGQFIRKEVMDPKVFDSVRDRIFGISYGFLVPVFFASLSFHLHITAQLPFLLFAVVLIAVAVAGKLAGCGISYALLSGNRWEGVVAGFGMNGRGAVEMVVASVVLRVSHELIASGAITEPLLTDQQFSALILMAFVTTLIAPVALKWAVKRACSCDNKAEFCELLEEQ
jgi:Kef-type K+ transport system membrane component KefB